MICLCFFFIFFVFLLSGPTSIQAIAESSGSIVTKFSALVDVWEGSVKTIRRPYISCGVMIGYWPPETNVRTSITFIRR